MVILWYYADTTIWPTGTMLMFCTMQTLRPGLLVNYVVFLVLCRHNDLAYWYTMFFLWYFEDTTIWPTGTMLMFCSMQT